MHPFTYAIALSLLAGLPLPGAAQAPGGTPVAQPVFEQLQDGQWVRLAGPEIGRRQGRVIGHTPTELVLAADPEPLRLPATAIDTVWIRGRSTVAGLVVGALIGGALGAVAGTELGEENAGSAGNIVGMAGLGLLGGGALGAAIGTAIPRWQQRRP